LLFASWRLFLLNIIVTRKEKCVKMAVFATKRKNPVSPLPVVCVLLRLLAPSVTSPSPIAKTTLAKTVVPVLHPLRVPLRITVSIASFANARTVGPVLAKLGTPARAIKNMVVVNRGSEPRALLAFARTVVHVHQKLVESPALGHVIVPSVMVGKTVPTVAAPPVVAHLLLARTAETAQLIRPFARVRVALLAPLAPSPRTVLRPPAKTEELVPLNNSMLSVSKLAPVLVCAHLDSLI